MKFLRAQINSLRGLSLRRKLFLSAFVIFFGLSAYLLSVSTVDLKDLEMADDIVFLDRGGEVLRHLPNNQGERHTWINIEDIPDTVLKAFLASEDERFFSHPGFDFAAIFRALRDNLKSGKIVSGASTITQQVSRLIYPRKRTYKDKFIEILRSIRLELLLSKEEILVQYLNRVPMGNNIIGVGLASSSYFGKDVKYINIAEAALLASLPRAPGFLNPYGKQKKGLLKRKDKTLNRMHLLGMITKEALGRALDYSIAFQEFNFPNEAPHLLNRLAQKKVSSLQTTLDLGVQKKVEEILRSHEVRLSYRGAYQASAMVVENSTMEVLASVGSLSYSFKNKGFNDGTSALRSAGSTLKPFAYALALENGHTISSLLEDTLKNYKTPSGDYLPVNYDRKEYGPVTMRSALGNSLNISAIKTLEKMRFNNFFQFLKKLNLVNDETKGADHYGLGLVIGNMEVTLEQLISAYATIANYGIYRPIKYFRSGQDNEGGRQLMSPQTAYIIADILSDPTARTLTFGNLHATDFDFKVSLKTGTSTKYRDGWIIGFTPDYTVGVWTGNFEGLPTYSLSGAEGAAPIFKEIISFLYDHKAPTLMAEPEGIVKRQICGISGMKPNQYCQYVTEDLFIQGTEPDQYCSFHERKEPYHQLPATYATWLFKKNQSGLAGNFRLRGFDERPEKLFSKIARLAKGTNERQGLEKHFVIGKRNAPPDSVNPDEENIINITYPLSGDHFLLDKRGKAQIINIEAQLQVPLDHVDWYIDGVHYARAVPPYNIEWNLKRGRHTITVVPPNKAGDEIEIFVE